MEALTIAIVGLLNIICLVTGVKIGQTTVKGKTLELPKINPLQGIKENRAKKEAEKEQEELNKILSNIDKYDGTSRGQQDI